MTAAAPAAAASHANHDISTPPFAYIYVDYSFFLTDSIKTINAKKMYDSIWNNYFERIDDIRVRVIQADVLQRIMNANMDKKRTCQKIKIVFNQVFITAVRERIIYYNSAEYLVIPKVDGRWRYTFWNFELHRQRKSLYFADKILRPLERGGVGSS